MTNFERTLTINADAERVFAYVSNIENLPQFLPTLESVEKLDAGRVRVRGHVHGRRYEHECFFRVDPAQHRVEWGRADDMRYNGHMFVHGGDTTRTLSELTIGLEFTDPGAASRGDDILDGIQQALETIRDQVGGRGGSAY